MGTFGNPASYNNTGVLGSATNPTTAVGLARDRENQKAILELPGTQAWQTISILDGAIAPFSSEVIVIPEGTATTDTLSSIKTSTDGTTVLHEGMLIRLKAASDNSITITNSAGAYGIKTTGSKDIVLGTTWYLELKLVGTSWEQQSVVATSSGSYSIDAIADSVNNVVSISGMTPVASNTSQLSKAITTLISNRSPDAIIPDYSGTDLGVAGFSADSTLGAGAMSKTIKLTEPGWVLFRGSKSSSLTVSDPAWVGAVVGGGSKIADIVTPCVYPSQASSVFFPASSASSIKLAYLGATVDEVKFFSSTGSSVIPPVTPPADGDLPAAPGPIDGGNAAETQTASLSCGGVAEGTRIVLFGGDAGFSSTAVGGGDSSNTGGDVIGGGGSSNTGGDVIGGGGASDTGGGVIGGGGGASDTGGTADTIVVYFGGTATQETPTDYIVCGDSAPYSATMIIDCGGAA